MIGFDIRADVARFQRELTAELQRQVPYATALAINAVADDVIQAERANMQVKLDRPTPFTLRSVRAIKATKRNLIGTVYVQDIAAEYLEPYEKGGPHKLIGKGRTWFNPKAVGLNQYGNLSARQLAALKSRPDVFVGKIRTKSGEEISGVWQRPIAAHRKGSRKGKVEANRTGQLKLLIRFGDEIQVRQHLGWHDVARATVRANLERRWRESMARAARGAR